MESRFPKELTAVFKGWENMSNPWSLASNSRGDWFEDLGVKTPAENPDFEYLYYVGCAGSRRFPGHLSALCKKEM